MPIFVGKNPDNNEECTVELDNTTSVESAKTQICDRLGVEPIKYNLVYRDEILLYQKSLSELNFSDDPKPTLCIARIVKSAKPINAFSFLGLAGLGPGASTSLTDEDSDEVNYPHPLPKYTDAGTLDDPRNFSIAKNSSFAFRVYNMIRQDYSAEDCKKIMGNITSEMQKLVDILNYDELEHLATECLQINTQRMESLRNQYICSFQNQTS